MPNQELTPTNLSFLQGGGEMGSLMRGKDWSATTVGVPSNWPQTLRTTISIILHSKFPMFLFWGQENICFYNDAYRPILGEKGKHPQSLGRKGEEVWPEIWPDIYPLIQHVLSGGESTLAEDQLLPIYRNGHIEDAYWNFNYSPVIGETGEVAGVFVACTETTEKIKAHHFLEDSRDQALALKKIEESEYRFRTLIEESVIAMSLYTGRDLVIQYANDAMIKFFGKTKSIIGKPMREAVPELIGQPFLEIFDNVYTTGKTYFGKEEAADLEVDGQLQTFYFDYTYKALRNKDGSVFGIHHTAIDVTKRVLADRALKQSEERFRQTVEQAPLGITILRGPDYFVEMANPFYLKIVNNTAENFVGKFLFDVLPQVRESIKGILADVLKTGVPYYGVEFPAYIKHGEEDVLTYFNFVYQPLRENDGSISGIIVVATDVSASVKAKHDLAESERQFRHMVVQSPIPMTILRGENYIIETANIAMFRNVWRKKNEDVIGKSILEVFPELNDQKYPELLKEVYSTGLRHTETESIAYVQGDDGMRKFYLDFEYAPLLDPDKTISGIIITVNDVTEKVEARLKAEGSEQKLNLVIDASDFGTWEWNMVTDEMRYSDRFLEMFGFAESAKVTHAQFVKRLHPDDMPVRAEAFDRAHKTGVLSYESRIIWSNGIQRWMEVRGKVYMDENGAPSFLIGTTRDTTDEKFHQQELEDRERKFRLLADSMPQMVWTGNAYGDLNYFNESVYTYSGLSRQEIADHGWLQIVHPDDKEENLEAWRHAVHTGTDFIFEHRFRRADGQYRWQLSRAIPQKDDLGNIRMWVGTSTDIQEIKELDEQKDLFIGMASHELKTPVTTVKGYVQLLQDMYSGESDAFLRHSLDRMHRQIETLKDLIADLLDLSKIKSGSLHFDKEAFDLAEMADEIVSNTRDVNPGYHIELSSSSKIPVHGDKNRISQVLINFLTNAIKYSPESKQIKVVMEGNAENAYVSVQDYGIGISKIDQEKIFQRFYRVEGKNEKTFPGFGIGLFISSEIIKKHNGKIGVISQEGEGSTFYFSIPTLNT
ncbi:MAG: PAS domain S-box protein [Chitinophagaceae bacterium]|nr:MAG: PAS domain S-box protein [Chitinophagaceae bacterium]